MSIRRVTFLLAFTLAACGPSNVWAQKPACSTAIVQTSSGPVCGITSKAPLAGGVTASAYLGIPYAVPPVGPLRWSYPRPFEGSSLLQATAYGNACPQSTVDPTASKEPIGSSSRCRDGQVLGPRQSEDCLHLNVWVPDGATASLKLPVMVFIHGGNFDQGSSVGAIPPPPSRSGIPGGNLYDGTYLAATGKVIVVTLNYRLGALGFLAQGDNHNFGFADQILALHWVRTNIANFGGDPHNVTLFGQSAGAKSVGLHVLSSPKSAGLFHAAIMESNALGLPYKSVSQARALRHELCSTRPSLCLTTTTACDLVDAQNEFMAAQPLSFAAISNFLWTPTVDDVYVTGQPISSAARLTVPLLVGTTHDEGTSFVYQAEQMAAKSSGKNPPDPATYEAVLGQVFGADNARKIRSRARYDCGASRDCSPQLVHVMTDFAFTCANRHLAIQATQGTHPQPIYLYQFDQVSSFNFWAHTTPPVPQCGGWVCHADELPYVFNTAWQFPSLISFTQPEELLAQTIGGYWTRFAHSRNPGSAWPLFQPKKTYLRLNEKSSTGEDPLDATANCSSLWDGIGYQTPEILAGLFRPFEDIPEGVSP